MKNILIILGSVYLMCSCSLLDVDPQDIIVIEDYYDTQEKLEIALNGVYATLADGDLYGNNMLGRMGLECDEGYENYNLDQTTVGYYVVSAADVKILGYWRSLYEGINRANALLDNMHRAANVDENIINNIRGQALFLRAYYYFMLVNKFGDVPLILNLAESTDTKNLQVPRTDAKIVYKKIIEDMEEASKLVSGAESYSGGGHVSKSAVWGILARVCLHAAGNPINDESQYEKAMIYADSVIQTGLHSLNPSYKQVFINYAQDKYDIKESIWEVEFWGNNTTSYTNVTGMVGRNLGIRNNNTQDTIGYAIGAVKKTDVLLNLYDDIYTVKNKDLRKDWNIALYFYRINPDNPTQSNKIASAGAFDGYCGKYRREYEILLPKSPTSTPINFPLLRYSDVLLMYAEAVNQKASPKTNEIANAYEYINMVRRRGYGVTTNEYDITSTDYPVGEQLLEFIQNERARELCFETLRKTDLVRWNIFYERMQYTLSLVPTGTSVVYDGARAFYQNVTPRDVIWPIPSYEMGVNKELVQNTGW